MCSVCSTGARCESTRGLPPAACGDGHACPCSACARTDPGRRRGHLLSSSDRRDTPAGEGQARGAGASLPYQAAGRGRVAMSTCLAGSTPTELHEVGCTERAGSPPCLASTTPSTGCFLQITTPHSSPDPHRRHSYKRVGGAPWASGVAEHYPRSCVRRTAGLGLGCTFRRVPSRTRRRIAARRHED